MTVYRQAIPILLTLSVCMTLSLSLLSAQIGALPIFRASGQALAKAISDFAIPHALPLATGLIGMFLGVSFCLISVTDKYVAPARSRGLGPMLIAGIALVLVSGLNLALYTQIIAHGAGTPL